MIVRCIVAKTGGYRKNNKLANQQVQATLDSAPDLRHWKHRESDDRWE